MAWSESRDRLTVEELREVWPILPPEERAEGFQLLSPEDADDFFLSLSSYGQASVLAGLPHGQRRLWMRLLAPDDAADVLHELEPDERGRVSGAARRADAPRGQRADGLRRGRRRRSDEPALRAHPAGHDRGRGDPLPAPPGRRTRSRPSTTSTCSTASSACSAWSAFASCSLPAATRRCSDVMETDVVTVPDDMDQEAVAPLVRRGTISSPCRSSTPRAREGHRHRRRHRRRRAGRGHRGHPEARRYGGPRRAVPADRSCSTMIKKRGGWLAALFIGEMLTATAMGHFEDEIAQGGRAGAVRAAHHLERRQLGLAGVHAGHPRDGAGRGAAARLVARRCGASSAPGLSLGAILGVDRLRCASWSGKARSAATARTTCCVALTVGVQPGRRRDCGARWPARCCRSCCAGSASTRRARRRRSSRPWSTSTGLVIYFSVAQLVLRGTLL